MDKSFQRYVPAQMSAGLTHQLSNLTAMIKEAHLCGRALVLPEFRLSGHHNHGRELLSTLSEYYDLSQAMVNGERLEALEPREVDLHPVVKVAAEENLIGRPERLIVKDVSGYRLTRKALEPVYSGFGALRVQVDIHPALREVAKRAAPGIPEHAAWIHVRRGDRHPMTAAATTPENILRTVKEVAPETRSLYIATDEPDLQFFAPLSEHFDVACWQDFPEFSAMGLEDNYRLFLAEKVFSRFFPVRISTFRTEGRGFQGALCETRGWQ